MTTQVLPGKVAQLDNDTFRYRSDASGELNIRTSNMDGTRLQAAKGGTIDPRFDSGDTLFLEHQLEFMLNRVIEAEYPEKKAMSLFPLNTQGGWANKITYAAYDRVGRAKIVCCANDWPRVALTGCKYAAPIVTIGSGYELCFEDINYARFANLNLEERMVSAVREAVMEEVNYLTFYGDTAAGVLGLANNPYLPRMAASFPIDATSSPEQILQMLHNAANYSIQATLGAGQQPNTMLLPISVWTYLSSTNIFSSINKETILECFLRNNQFINQVDWVPELETLGAGGTRAIFFYHRDPRSVELRMPVQFTQLAPFWNGMTTEVNYYTRFGGLWFYYPLRNLILEGV